jgi:hypothetical protein
MRETGEREVWDGEGFAGGLNDPAPVFLFLTSPFFWRIFRHNYSENRHIYACRIT